MKKIGKLSLAMGMVLTLVVSSLTGCGSNKEEGNGPETTSSSSKVEGQGGSSVEGEIEFWNFFTGPDGDNMTAMVEGFNATNPAYRVKNVTMASGDLYTKIPTVVNSKKDIPDLTIVDVARVPMFQKQGLLESVEGLTQYAPELKKENYNELVWNTGTYEGKQFSIPLDMGVIGVAYNKDLVDKYAPGVLDDNILTIDEIKEVIPKASADGIVTIPVSFFGYEMALSLAKQEGVDLFKDGQIPNLNSPEFMRAMNTLKEIQDLGGGSSDGEDNLQLFMSGEAVFCPDGVWDKNALSQIEGLNWGLTNSIAYTNQSFCNYSNSNQFVMLKSDERGDDKEKVIADFIEYVRLNSLEWAKSGQVPASNYVNDDAEYQKMNQYFFVSTPAMQESIQFKNYTYTGYADDAVNKVFNDIIFGNISVEDGMAQAQKEAEDNIAQNSK